MAFDPFPFVLLGITVNPEGKIEFAFAPLDDTAFFRLGGKE